MTAEPGSLPVLDWADEAGKRWLGGVDGLEAMIEPVGRAAIDAAGFEPGERVIDIGCGGGWTTREIAARVAPDGHALGLDISANLVALARDRAQGIPNIGPNISFHIGDAAVYRPDTPFDRIFSRFGVMFFTDFAAAFRNIRLMIHDRGRLDMAVWASAPENPWYRSVVGVIRNHVEVPTPPPHYPGPFALGDREYLKSLLTNSGFGRNEIREWEGNQHVGGPGNDPEKAADFMLTSMHVGDYARQGGAETFAAVRADLIDLFARHETPDGVALPAKVLIVTAWP